MHTEPVEHTFIYVNHVQHIVHDHELSGDAIKVLAGIPDNHVLCLEPAHNPEHERAGGNDQLELQVIADCEPVKMKNGLRFFTHEGASHPVTVTIDRKEYTFKHRHQTGKSIKARAGIPPTDVMFLQEEKEDRVITDEECITRKCGDCFHSAPPANYGLTTTEPHLLGFEGGKVLAQPDGWRFVVFENYALPDGFSARTVRLLVKLAPSFPDAAPDMFWVSPELRTSNNAVPQGTSLESLLGEQWQRFSWHLKPSAWKVGQSSLRDFLRCVRARFEKRN